MLTATRQPQRIELRATPTVGVAQTIWIAWIHETQPARPQERLELGRFLDYATVSVRVDVRATAP